MKRIYAVTFVTLRQYQKYDYHELLKRYNRPQRKSEDALELEEWAINRTENQPIRVAILHNLLTNEVIAAYHGGYQI